MNITIPPSIDAVLSTADCAGGVSEELISSIEQNQNLRFPTEYRAFLKKFGAALATGFEIYGLVEPAPGNEPPVWCDLRGLLGSSALEKMPRGLVPVSDDGGDYKFYLQCDSDASEATGSIVIYGPGIDGQMVSLGFFEFLERAALSGVTSLIPT